MSTFSFFLFFSPFFFFFFFFFGCLYREIAQLKLAEQIIAEKDHSLRTIEYRAEMAMMEKEALEEEVTAMRSIHNVNASHSLESTPTRVSLVVRLAVDDLGLALCLIYE